MLVREIMNRSYPLLYEDELATKARATLRNRGLRVVPVVDGKKRLVGMVSRGDLMSITSSISAIQVEGIMSTPKFVATVDTDAYQATQQMIRLNEWYTPVVRSSHDNTYAGVLGLEDFIKAILEKNISKLSKPLSDVMSTNIVTCSPDDEVDNVWRTMRERAFAGLPVLTKGRLIGIVTQKNLLDSGAILPSFESKKGRFKAPSKISLVMKTPVISLKPNDTIKEAAKLMLEKNIGRVPIVDDKGKLVGMVDREDIAKTLL